MDEPNRLVVFVLDEQRFALPLTAVERVVRAVEVTPLPQAPPIILGVINVQGRIIPVINSRQLFGLAPGDTSWREVDLRDQFIIANTSRRTVALLADAVSGVAECSPQEVTSAEQILPGLGYLAGVVKREDGIIITCNLDKILSPEAEQALDVAIQPWGEQP